MEKNDIGDNNLMMTPKDYLVNSIDELKEKISRLKENSNYLKAFGCIEMASGYVFCKIIPSISDYGISDYADVSYVMSLISAGLVFATSLFKYNKFAFLNEKVDALEEQLELDGICVSAKNSHVKAKKYRVKKIEDANERIKENARLAKLLFVVALVCTLAMILSNHYDNSLEGNLVSMLVSICTFLIASKSGELFIDVSKDERIIDRLNTELDMDEIKRTRNLSKKHLKLTKLS